MKKVLIILIYILHSLETSAQQVYRFQYQFHSEIFDNNNIELYVKNGKNYERRYFREILRGELGDRNKDTISLNFWPSLKIEGNRLEIDKNGKEHEKDYIIVIKNWNPENTKFNKVKIPFRQWELTATNIPFRVKFRGDNSLESEFLSFNITYLRVFGTTKIFQSRFVKPRNRSIAFGPYLGLNKIENPENKKSEFALNAGINAVYSLNKLNLVLAYGAENGFKKATNKLNPYIGFGIGFSLIDKFEPEIESK
ncbi:hypothetical protein [Hymenobacter metallilatus]|uniref:Uncharacterized protein n=1 Tax=Hymenobacter metallilatus TaxID=2493666 RepID=A0A3R9LUS0_9BACT|nr:hypothetical protein [Hymenobacter metallilatus]RSK23879.1 hypothetical protein EI290_21895 [Hymenobacter metallilatus]